MNIFVGSLPYSLQEADLQQLFEAYGEVSTVKIIIDRETGRSKGFGFVEMPDDETAQSAISGLNGSQVAGRSIAVSQAEDKKTGGGGRSGGFGGGNRGGGGGGGYSRDNRGGGGGYNKDNNRGGGGSRW
ncbi:RNA-binding protein [Mucilaginibacter pallidiroseus]|uniref:RNA-binding protein n=1 Tax=Mucilaginibacter pallidiroseus TaxID=2599295 RepID=A0A563UGW2_9SPHI|nr:RNA-binding protein [Mucilaginibacter pallidiroseus]TWR30571.1 RNA-binding protein [Mucilaginibacter pallidiroseus]